MGGLLRDGLWIYMNDEMANIEAAGLLGLLGLLAFRWAGLAEE